VLPPPPAATARPSCDPARGLGSGAAGSRAWMAAATEDPRLLGSAAGVEGAGKIDDAVGEQGRPRGDNDEEILRFMDSVDGYLVLMDSLSAALRQVLHQLLLLSGSALNDLWRTVGSAKHIDSSEVLIVWFSERSLLLD
jgi:hypothetical protein